MSDKIVVFGAGGLALGFFGPELRGDYEMTFLDTQVKADLIEAIQNRHQYVTNLAGENIEPMPVRQVDAFRIDAPEQDEQIREHVAQARIFYTAVGIRNLDSALAYLSERLESRRESIYILCAENGENIAEQWRVRLPGNIHVLDTVMGRMCRLEEEAAPDYAPVAPGIRWGVVGEAFYGMPLSKGYYDAEVFHSKAFEFVSEAEFHARDRVKLYAHNGMHFFFAAQGRLRGVERFSDLAADVEVMAAARELIENEIAPALWKDCAWRIGKDAFNAYMTRLPSRLVSPTLRDNISRGVRGLAEKFAPNERVIGGLRLLLDNGVEPDRYYDLIAAGLEVARRDLSEETARKLLDSLPGEKVRRETAVRWERLK